MGASVAVKDDNGFLYRVSASTPQLVAQVSVIYPGSSTPTPLIAPPGKDYITIELHVANAASDRPEPVPLVFDLASQFRTTPLVLAAPTADRGAFGDSACPCALPPTDVFGIDVADATVSSAPDLPIGGSEDLLLFVHRPVPSSAPVRDIIVYWDNGRLSGQDQVTAIPTPGQ